MVDSDQHEFTSWMAAMESRSIHSVTDVQDDAGILRTACTVQPLADFHTATVTKWVADMEAAMRMRTCQNWQVYMPNHALTTFILCMRAKIPDERWVDRYAEWPNAVAIGAIKAYFPDWYQPKTAPTGTNPGPSRYRN